MDEKAEYFVNEFVIGLGFLSGLWIAIGIDPQAEIFKAFATIIKTLNPNSGFGLLFFLLFFIIPLIILICLILGTYFMGGIVGLIAVVFGFLGGLLILASTWISTILLLIGMGLGIIAAES